MSAEKILITHAGYTDTAYASCGSCTLTLLRALGVPEQALEEFGTDLNDVPIGDDVSIAVASLGESDSCEWCARCGEFLRHGIRYEGEDVGCTHELDEWGHVKDPADQDGPHTDFRDNSVIREFWG